MIAAAVSSFALAESSPAGGGAFLSERARGWFWYEQIPVPQEEEKEPEKEEPPKVIIAPQEDSKKEAKSEERVPTFSVEWFRENYLKLFEEAIDNPTKENVDKYRIATRVMLDKASNIAEVFRERVALDPDLDESVLYPISTALRSHQQYLQSANSEEVIAYLRDKIGIWVFLDENCEYCAIQGGSVKEWLKKNKIEHAFIVKQGRPFGALTQEDNILPDIGQSETLGIKITPAIVMVDPSSEKFIVLSQGLISTDVLQERLLLAAKDQGIIDRYQYAAVSQNSFGLLSPEQIKDMADIDSNDFSKQVRQALRANLDTVQAHRMKLGTLSHPPKN